MVGRHTQTTIVLSTVIMLSISMADMHQIPTSPGLDTGTDNPESIGLATERTGAQTGSAAVMEAGSEKLAGNAPCNPEQEVCNK